MIPLPSEDVTPPVTKIYFAVFFPLAAMMERVSFGLITGYKVRENSIDFTFW
jgi:elongation factor P hydroxylase